LAGSYLSAATRSPARRMGAAPRGLRLLPLPARRKGEADTAARSEGAIAVKTGKGAWKLPEGPRFLPWGMVGCVASPSRRRSGVVCLPLSAFARGWIPSRYFHSFFLGPYLEMGCNLKDVQGA
jgi:hypothetical protein